MAATSRSEHEESESSEAGKPVAAYESRPGRLVFVEEGNADGWIATDLSVDPLP